MVSAEKALQGSENETGKVLEGKRDLLLAISLLAGAEIPLAIMIIFSS